MQKNKFENTHVTYAPKAKPLKNESDKFSQQQITFEDTPLLFPAGLEKLFLLIYFVTLPYIAGLMFLFFYVGEGRTELFLSLNEDSSFILTWAIGYEILAGLILLYIVKLAISFSINNSRRGARKNFRRP
ncbi:MAG TPA: hypothetical protein ENK90_03285 [Epsilonproteobacteria bacterium]|nr:hypothetical protein [Campylobacterota bacterium]HHE06123.1 hypothetical protein [Campylobacterota bacterium]